MKRTTAATVAVAAAPAAYWASMSERSQVFGPFPSAGPGDGPNRGVALTFDDGPNEPYTSRLLDILDARGVRATFFQVGAAARRQPDAARAVLERGHVVGNHSHTHRFTHCFTPARIDDEVARAQDALGDVLGVRPALYRPPWLARVPSTFRVLERHGLHAVSGVFCHPGEVFHVPGPRIAATATARAAPGRIVIFHDGYNGQGADRSRTLDAVARTIDRLADRDAAFTTIDALLGLPAYQPP